MDAEVFTDQRVKDLIARDYVPVRLDADKKKAEMQTFNVPGLPTIVIEDSQGQVLETIVGYVDADTLAEKLESTAKKR